MPVRGCTATELNKGVQSSDGDGRFAFLEKGYGAVEESNESQKCCENKSTQSGSSSAAKPTRNFG
jgi:hypothetical protein